MRSYSPYITFKPGKPFGSPMSGRTYEKDTSNRYRFGMNTQEKDDEIYGKGNASSAEFWEYDTRLGRRWNLDPLAFKFPWQSPYVCFNNNPLSVIDYKGLEGVSYKKKDRTERKFERKFERWKRNNPNLLSGNDLDRYERFKNSRNWLGQIRGNTKWFEAYEKNNKISETTHYEVKVDVPDPIVINSAGIDIGSANVTRNTGTSQGTLTVNYDMFPAADRLQILNPTDGTIIFDTNIPVVGTTGSGRIVPFNLGIGNTSIQILVNGGITTGSTAFIYNIIVTPTILSKQTILRTKAKKK